MSVVFVVASVSRSPQRIEKPSSPAMSATTGMGCVPIYASRISRAPSGVHDLMQAVYLRLLRMPRHEAVRNPQAYLFTVAHRVLYEH